MNRRDARILFPAATIAAVAIVSTTLASTGANAAQKGAAAAESVAMAAPAVMQREGIRFVVGGVGVGARETMERMAGEFNTRLTFAAGEDRHLVVDVDVSIIDTAGVRRLAQPKAGPMLYAELPAGTYEVQARYQGQMKTRRIEVVAGGTPAIAGFRW